MSPTTRVLRSPTGGVAQLRGRTGLVARRHCRTRCHRHVRAWNDPTRSAVTSAQVGLARAPAREDPPNNVLTSLGCLVASLGFPRPPAPVASRGVGSLRLHVAPDACAASRAARLRLSVLASVRHVRTGTSRHLLDRTRLRATRVSQRAIHRSEMKPQRVCAGAGRPERPVRDRASRATSVPFACHNGAKLRPSRPDATGNCTRLTCGNRSRPLSTG